MFNTLLSLPPQAADTRSPWMSLMPFLLIIVVFYFFFIRPQLKKQKDAKKYREALKKGDKVITIGGIHGKIAEVQDTTFTLEVAPDIRFRIEKSAVAQDGPQEQLGENK